MRRSLTKILSHITDLLSIIRGTESFWKERRQLVCIVYSQTGSLSILKKNRLKRQNSH